MKRKKKAIFIISLIIILMIVCLVFIMRLGAYSYNATTETIEKDGVEYVLAKSFPSSFLDEREKRIGKIKGFFVGETWVIKIKNVDEHEMFLVTGLMNVELFVRKDKAEEFNKTLAQ